MPLHGGGNAAVVLSQASHVHFIDDVVFLRAGGLGADALTYWHPQDALWRHRAAIAVTVASPGGIDRAVGPSGVDRVLADFVRIRVDQQLVGIEAVALGVHVGDKAGAGTPVVQLLEKGQFGPQAR